jgi:hypothetical protein
MMYKKASEVDCGREEHTECNKEFRVMTVIKVVYELPKDWDFRQNGDDFWSGNELPET